MSNLVVPQIPVGLTNEELGELVAKALKEIDWAINGNISDQNISRIANFLASKTEFKHISGLVGLSGFDAANPLAVRLWAGNADKSIGPWRVLQNGYMYSTRGFIGGWDIDEDKLSGTGTIEGGTIIGAYITTADGTYPRVDLSSSGNIFQAYKSATDYIAIDPDATGSPTLIFENGLTTVYVSAISATYSILASLGNISINSQNGDLTLSSGAGKYIKVAAWSKLLNLSSGQTLQQDLDSKQGAITSGDVTVVAGVATLGNNINATHLANGNVSNTEFQYLDGVTSAIQTQLNTKATVLSGGTRIESGTITVNASVSNGFFSSTLTFPTAFTNPPIVQVSFSTTGSNALNRGDITAAEGITSSQCDVYVNCTATGTKTIHWTAIGT